MKLLEVGCKCREIVNNTNGVFMSYKINEIPISERPRERALEYGVSILSDAQLLAILLKTGYKNRDVLELSMDFLSRYSIAELKNVSFYDLIAMKGIGEAKALEILSAIELGRRIFLRKKDLLSKYINAKEIWEGSRYLFFNLKQEYFYCLYFNHRQELLERKLLFMGTINKSVIHPREVFKEAYRLSASSIICMHNHPSGDVMPSKEDILLTDHLVKTGHIQGIPVLDHIIIGEDAYYSFYEHHNILNL